MENKNVTKNLDPFVTLEVGADGFEPPTLCL